MGKSLITTVFDLAHGFVRYRAAASLARDMAGMQAENEISAPSTWCVEGNGPPVTEETKADDRYYTAQANYIAARDTSTSPGDEITKYFNCE